MKLRKYLPIEAAKIIAEMPLKKALRVVNKEDEKFLAYMFVELRHINSEYAKEILTNLEIEKIARILQHLESDDATDLLKLLPKNKQLKVLLYLPKELKENIKKLLKYPEETAGSIMRKEALIAYEDETVKEMLSRLKPLMLKENTKLNTIFVLNRQNRLVGYIPLAKAIFADENKKVKEIMNRNVVSVHAYVDQEKVAEMFKKYNFYSLPVVDRDKHFLGVITVDDIIDVMEEEATEDIYGLAGLPSEETVYDSWISSVKRRLPWLLANLFTAFISAYVVSLFQESIREYVVLAIFMPIIAGMAGNAGTQTLTIVVRAIALEQIKGKTAKMLLMKEAKAAFVNGIICGIVAAIYAMFFSLNPYLGIIVIFSMTVSLVTAALAGSIIPLLLKRFNIDPAIASSIFLTTLTDAIGFLSFLGTGTILLNYLK